MLWLCTLKENGCLVKILHNNFSQLQKTVHHCLFIYKTSREPTPLARIQGLPGAPPPDPWLHPNISLGCTLSQYSCWLRFIPTLVLAALHPNIIVGYAKSQHYCWLCKSQY
jgi:hypothetical protein